MSGVLEKVFYAESVRLEGKTDHCYLDVKGLLSYGIGNLGDRSVWNVRMKRTTPPPSGRPWEPMIVLPWCFRADDAKSGFQKGQPADARQKIIEWCWIWGADKPDEPLEYDPEKNLLRKHRLQEAQLGGGRFRSSCKLYLPEDAIQSLFSEKMRENESTMREKLPFWDSMPAAARLALHLLAWADGANFASGFPKLMLHLEKDEYAIYRSDPREPEPELVAGAAIECHLDTKGNNGLIDRNALMQKLFEEAEASRNMRLDPDVLFYPRPIIGSLQGDSTPPIATSEALEDTAPYPIVPTLGAFGTENPDVAEASVELAHEAVDAFVEGSDEEGEEGGPR